MRLRLPLNVLAAIAAAGLSAHAAQQATFSTRTESVRLDVLVTEGGRIVGDLGPSDFEIRDEGVLQQVEIVSFQQLPLHVVLVLDLSYSVAGERLDSLRAASMAVLDALAPTDRASLLTFAHGVRRRSEATSNMSALRATLGAVGPDGLGGPGGTALADATYAALLEGETGHGRPLVLVFSDGVDTGSWLSPTTVLDAARRTSAVVYGVSERGSGGTPFLRNLSDLTGGAVYEAESETNLRATFVRVLEEFRSRYLLSYSPRGVPAPGWHRLDVRVKGRRAAVRARPGYMAN